MAEIKKLGQYKGIEVQVKRQEVTQKEVDQQIQLLLLENFELIDKDGKVENGDMTTIDFDGYKDGEPFEGGSAKSYQLEVGSHTFIPGFEEQMIGMEVGETRDLNVTFPTNYGNKDLAGAAVVFKVTLHKVQSKKDAVLNDDFVAKFDVPNMKTVEDLKNQMKASIQAEYDQKYRSTVENMIMDKLIEACEVEVDDEDIENGMQQHFFHLRNELARQGMELEKYLQMTGTTEEMLREQLLPSAKKQAVFATIINEIVRIENIVTNDEEAMSQIEYMAKQNNLTKEEALEKVDLEGIKEDLCRLKASQIILQSAKITE